MIRYVAMRLLLFIPTLLVITLLAFALSKLAPGDPILILYGEEFADQGGGDLNQEERIYQSTAHQLGLDKPVFYFDFTSAAFPDTMYRILNRAKRKGLRDLCAQYGNPKAALAFYSALRTIDQKLYQVPDSLQKGNFRVINNNIRQLYNTSKESVVLARLENIRKVLGPSEPLTPFVIADFHSLDQKYQSLLQDPKRWNLYVPVIRWNGFQNQYHHWLSNLLRGDFGKSYKDGRPVGVKIWEALMRTLLLNGVAVVLAFGIAIPLGVQAAARKGSLFDRWVTILLFGLYSLPTFWVGTLLLVFFTTPEYGMDWFPTLGLNSSQLSPDAPFAERFWDTAYHMVLPVFCLTYASLAYISRQMRNSMDLELNKLYILTAKAKGLSEKAVVWKHAFRNALFPIITLIASIFPFLLAGSFVIEFIFNISGMGLVTIQSIFGRDWPMVFGILVLSAIFTIIGILLADIMYALADPRIKYSQSGNLKQ